MEALLINVPTSEFADIMSELLDGTKQALGVSCPSTRSRDQIPNRDKSWKDSEGHTISGSRQLSRRGSLIYLNTQEPCVIATREPFGECIPSQDVLTLLAWPVLP